MFKTNFYNGEMSMNEQYISETEATQNAGFGQYTVQQPNISYGLGGNVYQNQCGPPQTTMYNNPYMNQPYYGNRFNTGYYGNGNGYNPVPNYMQFYNKQETQKEPEQAYIPPLAPSGSYYMLPSNFDEVANELISIYAKEEVEFQGKQMAAEAAARRNGQQRTYSYNNNYQYNYYGNPFFAPIQQQFRSSIIDELDKIKASAREARYNFDVHMSKLAHHYLNDGVTDEQIEELYTGYYVPVENNVYTNCSEQIKAQEMISNMVEVDPTEPYRLAQLAVQREIQSILPPDTTLEEFGPRVALLYSKWELEELYERRRSFRQDYNPDTYRRLLREKIAEKEANKQGFSLIRSEIPAEVVKITNEIQKMQSVRSDKMSSDEKTSIMKNALSNLGMPLLSNCISFDEKGNMVVKANIGNAQGQDYISNENESYYANKRAMFAGFLDSIPRSEELHDQKIQQYNDYSNYQNEQFKWDITHPKPSTEHNSGGG